MAYPDKVDRVKIVSQGDGGRIFKHAKRSPFVVVSLDDGEEYVVELHRLYRNHLTASIQSAELQREIDDTP